MKSVVLSTTEAEYVAVSEVVKEIKFLYQMLKSMETMVPLPIKVQVDNVGAIWLANNSSVSERTKHVDLWAHFVRDMIKDQVIEINFVKSAENDSYIIVEKLQFSFNLDLLSPEIYNSLCSFCLHVSFTAYENFYKLSKMHCLLILFSTFYPSEISENRNPIIKHISTYTLIPSSISTYVVDHFLVIFSP